MFNRKRGVRAEFQVASPLRYAVVVIGGIALNIAAWSGVYSQVTNPGIQQGGAVTVNNCAKWGPGIGQMQDAGGPCALGTASALTKTDDTNVTLTLSGSPASALLAAVGIQAGWSGTLAAARLNSNVVQSVTNDTNVTGVIAAQVLTLGWSGTLAASRLNANVVQSFTNDANITAAIAAQNATLAWSGQLSIARGGTGQATASAAIAALMPAPTRAGDIVYWNGSIWTTLAGNNVGTQTLSENASGVPSWSAAGTGTVTEQKNTASVGIAQSGNCDNTTTNAASPCDTHLSLTNASLQSASLANPTGTASATAVMMGLGTTCKLTPVYSGRIHFALQGSVNGATAGQASQMQLRFGTGTAPVNAAAATGTQLGSTLSSQVTSTNFNQTFHLSGLATGLTPGTAYWFDLGLSTSSGNAAVTAPSCEAFEY